MAFQIKIYEKRTHLGTDLDIYIYCISSSVNKNRHKGSELSITTTLKRTRQMTPVAFGNTPSDRTFRRTQILKYCVLYCFQWEWEKILRAKDSASPRTNTLMTRLLSIVTFQNSAAEKTYHSRTQMSHRLDLTRAGRVTLGALEQPRPACWPSPPPSHSDLSFFCFFLFLFSTFSF